MLSQVLASPLRRIRHPDMQIPCVAMRPRLLTRLRGRTTRLILGTMHRASPMGRELITLRNQAITVTGIIARVATRIRAGKKGAVKHVKAVRKGGRPSRADALKLRERILQVATELFLEEGYGPTSIESVAARAGVSKRTFYDRFDDKAVLFAAVVHYIIEHIRPPADVPLLAGASLPEILQRLAGLILKAALSPRALALHRLVTGESSRFPELAFAVETEGGQSEATDLIAGLLAREQRNAKIGNEDQRFAADQFIYMVVTLPQRRALGFGKPMTAAELDAWAYKVVILFLEGYTGLRK
jgi:TetR/AcrR family transcriptional regulator, mexJK operon transcriptional repressor